MSFRLHRLVEMKRLFLNLTLAALAALLGACSAARPATPRTSTPVSSIPPPSATPSPASPPPRDTGVPGTPTPQTALVSVKLAQVPATLTFPAAYRLTRSQELNRRGSFVSYDFSPDDYQTPYLAEVQFFSADSIADFTGDCGGKPPCFVGDYPDLDRYNGQLQAYTEQKDYQDFHLRRFGDRYYFVSEHPCQGDQCVIREYTTFIAGDIKVDVWIIMADESQADASDELFSLFQLQE
jgi:hypothetical protein